MHLRSDRNTRNLQSQLYLCLAASRQMGWTGVLGGEGRLGEAWEGQGLPRESLLRCKCRRTSFVKLVFHYLTFSVKSVMALSKFVTLTSRHTECRRIETGWYLAHQTPPPP